MSTEAEMEPDTTHVITDTEALHGSPVKHEFMAETRQLLDIVAKSLYSEKEVFIREIVSNSSDALEKLRHFEVTGKEACDPHLPFEIHLSTDEEKQLFVVQDFGVGMTQEELVTNLGTIAKSGSKAFMQGMDDKSADIIGQFGVGFYSTFMVGSKIDVYSKSFEPGSQGYHWTSDGSGAYEITPAEGVMRGTKVIIQLKEEDKRFSIKSTVEDIIKRYSNFVGFPIFLNGTKLNQVQALWTQSERDVTDDDHEKFYQFICNTMDTPRYKFMFKADVPLSIASALYVPTNIPEVYGYAKMEPGVSLYSRKILIQSKAKQILPDWLRFIRGVVDSEDIPLNLSRELLQESALIRKLSDVIVSKLLRFFLNQAKNDEENFNKFMKECGDYFREGVWKTESPSQREDIAKLLRFESSSEEPGKLKGLGDYVKGMKEDQKEIYFMYAPNRQLAESSPYYEALKAKDVEVLFTYEEGDEVVMTILKEFNSKPITSAENYLVQPEDKPTERILTNDGDLTEAQITDLMKWMETSLGPEKVFEVKSSNRIVSHPAMITVSDMASARGYMRLGKKGPNAELINMQMMMSMLKPVLEVNPSHEIVKSLHVLREKNPSLAEAVVLQLHDNAMITAGLMDNPMEMVGRLNSLLGKVMGELSVQKKSKIITDF
jgi:TNF receptor-associated protein 1